MSCRPTVFRHAYGFFENEGFDRGVRKSLLQIDAHIPKKGLASTLSIQTVVQCLISDPNSDFWRRCRHLAHRLPVNREIILQKLATPVFSRIDSIKKRVTDPCCTINDIQRRLEVVQFLFAPGELRRVFIGHPAGIHGIHKNSMGGELGCRGMGQHIECRFGHVGLGMTLSFFKAHKLAFHGRDIDDMFVEDPKTKRLQNGTTTAVAFYP
jgi:hypothetical protein